MTLRCPVTRVCLYFAKQPLIIGLFCGKWPVKIRHPMGLRHPFSHPPAFLTTYHIYTYHIQEPFWAFLAPKWVDTCMIHVTSTSCVSSYVAVLATYHIYTHHIKEPFRAFLAPKWIHTCMSHVTYMYDLYVFHPRTFASSTLARAKMGWSTVTWRCRRCSIPEEACVCMSHVTYMYESCHIYVWVMPHTCMSHVTYAL